MSASVASLSQRMCDAVDFGPVKYGHAAYVDQLMVFVAEVAALEAQVAEARKIINEYCKACHGEEGYIVCSSDQCWFAEVLEALEAGAGHGICPLGHRLMNSCHGCPCRGRICEDVDGVKVSQHPKPCRVPLKYFDAEAAAPPGKREAVTEGGQ